MFTRHEPSLLDTAGVLTATWWVGFKNGDQWWNRHLTPGKQHVDLWRMFQYGDRDIDKVWMQINPCVEMIASEVYWTHTPPWEREPETKFLRATSAAPIGRARSRFHFGPITCVDVAKLYLGISKPFLLTPAQLWTYLKKQPTTVEHI